MAILGVARDVKQVALEDVHTGKEPGEVGANDLLDPDESNFAAVAAAGRLLQRDQLGQRRGHFDAREVLFAFLIANAARRG